MIIHYSFIITVSICTAMGMLFWWKYLAASPEDQHRYLERNTETPIGMLDVVIALMLWLGFPTLAVGVLTMLWGTTDLESLSSDQTNILMLVLAAAQLIGCGVIVLLTLIRYGNIGWLFGERHTWNEQIWLAAKSFCMVVPLVWAIQAFLSLFVAYEHNTLEQLTENFSLMTMVSTWFGAVIAAPIVEELVFRGVLQSWLQRASRRYRQEETLFEFIGGWSPSESIDQEKESMVDEEPFAMRRIRWWMPIVVSSAVFALIHVGQGAAPIPLFFFAISLGFLFRYTGSLFSCIVLHFMLNAFTMNWLTLELIFGPVKETI